MSKSEYQKVAADKKSAKTEVLKRDEKGPLLVVFAPSSKGGKSFPKEQFYQLLEGLLILPSHVVIVSDEEPADAVQSAHGKFSWINPKEGRNEKDIEKFLQAADMALVFEEHMKDVERLLNHGVVVIGYEKSPLLENYKPNEETGNAFTFASMNPWDIFRALVRAHETYMFPYDWANIVRGILKRSS